MIEGSFEPEALCLTHFGRFDDVAEQLERLRESLAARSRRAREIDASQFAAWSEAETRARRGLRHRRGAAAGGASRTARHGAAPLLGQGGRVGGPPVSPETIEKPRVGGPGSGLGGNWRVIVLNDNHNTFDGVAAALARVIPGMTLDSGYAMADQIHNTGQAIVYHGHEGDRPSTTGSSCATPA